jgi:hypothetical protein
MKTLWKVFWIAFAFLFLIIIIGGLLVIARGGLPFKDYLPPIAGVPAVVALFAYAFRKKVWQSGVYVWRVYLFAFIALIIYQDWSSFSKNNNMPLESWIEYGISLIIMILSFWGTYLYAFRFLKVNNKPLTNLNH